MTFSADFSMDVTDPNNPLFVAEFNGKNTIDALSGDLYVYLSVDLLFWSDSWKWSLWSWDGYHDDGYLFTPLSYREDIFSGETVQLKNLQVTIWDAAITCGNKDMTSKKDGAVMHCETTMEEGGTHKTTQASWDDKSGLPSIQPMWQTELPVRGTNKVAIIVRIDRILPASGGHAIAPAEVLFFYALYDPQTNTLSGLSGPADQHHMFEAACGWMHISARQH